MGVSWSNPLTPRKREDVEELIINGFIREIERSFKNDTIVPMSIYQLCLSFFHQRKDVKLIWCKRQIAYNNSRFYKSNHYFGVVDFKHKSNFNLKSNLLKDCWMSHRDCCHIPNISYYLPKDMINNNYHLNGIFANAVKQSEDKSDFQYLMLYDDNNPNDETYEYKSNKSINITPNNYIYLDNKQTIIGQIKGTLYELKLQNIKSKDDFGQFAAIEQSNVNILTESYRDESLNMLYLSGNNSIFAVKCTLILHSNCGRSTVSNTQCWIYNMNENKWIALPDFKFNKTTQLSIQCLLCYDDYQQNKVYISAKHQTKLFDLNENHWISICGQSISPYHCSTMWCEQDMLYAVEGHKQEWKLYTLDTRIWRPTWNKQDIQIDGLPNEYFESHSGHLFY